jgi:carboxypeptidase C (cathepsin A)
MQPSYTEFAWHNTYGIQAINETEYHRQRYHLERHNGVLDRIRDCQAAARQLDPHGHGDVESVIKICTQARDMSAKTTFLPYYNNAAFNAYDITHPRADPFPGAYLDGYLNRPWVQSALGVPVNYSEVSMVVNQAFEGTIDFSKGGMVEDIAYLLDNGVKVAFMYGDRDFICNWMGGEETSKQIPYSHQADFLAAGYEPIAVNPFYSGGLVRQYGNFSFSRVYQAGHMIPAYQPETALAIFERAIFNRDIATGQIDLTAGKYSSSGPDNTWHRLNDVLPAPKPICYIFAREQCTDEQWESFINGTAVVKDWVVQELGSKNAVDLITGEAQKVMNTKLDL